MADVNSPIGGPAGDRDRLREVLGRVGLWTAELDRRSMADAIEGVRALDEQGWKALWIPEGPGREPFSSAATYLSATSRLTLATGIASIHARTAHTAAAGWATLSEAFPDRFVLGLGASHASMVESLHGRPYERPLHTMATYLAGMDAAALTAPPGEPARWRVLAALGPRMLELAAERAHGAHPYLVPVEHTSWARGVLGPDPVLAPEQAVVLVDDLGEARSVARRWVSHYTAMPNYERSLRRLGFGDADVADVSDRLVDALVATGGISDAVERVGAHLEAGADHVCIQVLRPSGSAGLPVDEWAQLAEALRP